MPEAPHIWQQLRANLANAGLMPLVGVFTPDLRYLTGFGGPADNAQLMNALATARRLYPVSAVAPQRAIPDGHEPRRRHGGPTQRVRRVRVDAARDALPGARGRADARGGRRRDRPGAAAGAAVPRPRSRRPRLPRLPALPARCPPQPSPSSGLRPPSRSPGPAARARSPSSAARRGPEGGAAAPAALPPRARAGARGVGRDGAPPGPRSRSATGTSAPRRARSPRSAPACPARRWRARPRRARSPSTAPSAWPTADGRERERLRQQAERNLGQTMWGVLFRG